MDDFLVGIIMNYISKSAFIT